MGDPQISRISQRAKAGRIQIFFQNMSGIKKKNLQKGSALLNFYYSVIL